MNLDTVRVFPDQLQAVYDALARLERQSGLSAVMAVIDQRLVRAAQAGRPFLHTATLGNVLVDCLTDQAKLFPAKWNILEEDPDLAEALENLQEEMSGDTSAGGPWTLVIVRMRPGSEPGSAWRCLDGELIPPGGPTDAELLQQHFGLTMGDRANEN